MLAKPFSNILSTPMPTQNPQQDYAFFCDEAGISNDRYTVVGGLCVHRSTIDIIRANIGAFRAKTNMTKELKWTKITDQKEAEYISLVDYFFAMNNINHCQFHCVIFDNHAWQHRKYNNGDSDVGLSKLYYQLLNHRFARNCASNGTLYVRLDKRNSSTSLNDMRDMLNFACAKDHGITGSPFKLIESADSKECDILQLNDVILGAVCAAKNGKHILETTRKSKRTIAQLVLDKSGAQSFDRDTPRSVARFSVWNFRARK
ncbi:DUF3800 domain-containing protein [Methylobacterium sp. E-045]|uniref:DUF3800 domain-containing protein n=1 Tax=Methylobacterium sp. E-045 TaxID=2836575 RepID=UPI001FB91C40|nr:DUF3800 domain-containing protein [Methylobacterium sp. E-045]